jgi:hypothetical protein
MPLHLEGPEPAAAVPAEGQFVYEVLAEVVRELEPETLMALVGSIQRGDPWPRLPRATREIFADLDARLFDGGE